MNLIDIFGKSVVKKKDAVLYERFPESDIQFTLPAGFPSLPIDSFIRGKWYQLKDPDGNLYYLKQDETDQFVDGTVKNIGAIQYGRDQIGNFLRRFKKNTGFVADGFKNSIINIGDDVKGPIKLIVYGIPLAYVFSILIKAMKNE